MCSSWSDTKREHGTLSRGNRLSLPRPTSGTLMRVSLGGDNDRAENLNLPDGEVRL